MPELKGFENIGAMMILAILIYRLPTIVTAFNSGVQLIINNVQVIQDKALTVYKEQSEKDRMLYAERFVKIEITLDKLGQSIIASNEMLGKVFTEQALLKNRVEYLEHVK